MILFVSLFNPVSKNRPALAFHVKSMRVAQFIKLDGRALNGEFLDPAHPSRIGETKKGSWHEVSLIPWWHWWMTFLPPLPPRARVQYVQDLLIYPYYLIHYHMLLQGVHERRLRWILALRLLACSHTVCESCISLAAASGEMTTCSAWIEYSEYNQSIVCNSRVSWTPG